MEKRSIKLIPAKTIQDNLQCGEIKDTVKKGNKVQIPETPRTEPFLGSDMKPVVSHP